MSNEQPNNPLNNFVPRFLPWILGLLMLGIYVFTLNPWVSLLSLSQIAQVAGWQWQPQLHSPLTYLVTLPFRLLPGSVIPVALNLFSAVCAAAALGLLARIITILPHDRTDLERTRERSDFGFLTGWAAWFPPVLAVLLGGLQFTQWLHATNFTGVSFDFLLFVVVLWQLMEYRLDEREGRLYAAAFIYGAGIAEDWAFTSYFLVFLTAIIWLRKLEFFNLRFLSRMTLLGIAGLLLFLLLPTLAAMKYPLTFWEALKPNLQVNWMVIKAVKLDTIRHNLQIMSLTTLLPVLLISFRWSASFGDRSHIGTLLVRYMFHVVNGVMFFACVWIMFDPPFSPHQLALGSSALTLYAMALLSIGYFSGYFLLVFGKAPKSSRRHSRPAAALPEGMRWLAPVIVAGTLLLAAGAVTLLINKNAPAIRLANDKTLLEYAQFTTEHLPLGRGILLSDSEATGQDQPIGAFLMQAALARQHKTQDYLVVDTLALNLAPYHRFLHAKAPAVWPLVVGATNQGVVSPVGLLSMLNLLSKSNNLCYLNPSFGYYFEQFYQEPHGLAYHLKPLPEATLVPPPLNDKSLAENEQFWKHVSDTSLDAITHGMNPPDYAHATGTINSALKNLHAPVEPNINAAYAGIVYSRALNYWGVQLQRAGKLPQAARCFTQAARLNPDNVVAKINLEFNGRLQSGQTNISELNAINSDQFGKYRNWNELLKACGPFDETSFSFEDGAILAGQNALFRQAIVPFKRVRELAPDNLAARLWLAQLYLFNHLPDSALEALQEPLEHPDHFGLTPTNSTELHVLASAVCFQKNELERGAKYLENEVNQHPEDDTLLSAATQAFFMRGLYTNALRTIEHRLARTPDDPQWLFGKGYASLQLSRYSQAITAFSRVLEINPNNADTRFNRAIAYLKSDDLDLARADYLQLQATYTNSFQVAYGLGEIAARQRATNEAVRNYKIFLSNAPTNAAELPGVRERLSQWGVK
jgi:tetratricopeptide (TPR) repeat protein